jgi:SAM-dependent methyltransferase
MVTAAEATFWERAAETRWGRYLSGEELAMLEQGARAAGKPGRALEVGAEGGRWSSWLIQRGWDVTCTDVDAATLATCARRLPEAECILVDASAESLPCESGSIALLLVYEVASVTQSDWFPFEAARVLQPDGVLVCSHHNSRSARAFGGRLLDLLSSRRRQHSDHAYRGGTYARFRDRLRDRGIVPEHAIGLGWSPFTRQSNSPLIPVATSLEALLGLRRLPSLSPFVLVRARRSG